MTSVDKSDLASLALAGNYAGIENRIRVVSRPYSSRQLNLHGSFYYLTFRDSSPTLTEFVEYIYWRMIAFCLPRAERASLMRQYSRTHDERYIIEMVDRARNLFVAAKKARVTSGEPGELILFILLEAFLDAPQVACKMYLKTNKNVPVHGTDSIHIRLDKSSGRLMLFWGESKLYEDLSDGLSAIVTSIKSFITPTAGTAGRDRDISILRDHTNVPDKNLRKAILNFFDPYSEKSNQRIEVFGCLAAFNHQFLNGCQTIPSADVEKKFLAEYQMRINSACRLFESKIRAAKLASFNFHLLLLPFRSLQELREAFYRKLGVDCD